MRKSFVFLKFLLPTFQGYHKLKWVYRKNCYSFNNRQYVDRAFIKSITMVSSWDNILYYITHQVHLDID